MTKGPNLYAIVVRHMNLQHGYAVRATTPAAAVSVVFAQGEHAQHFTTIEVVRLVEIETPAEGDAAT